MISAPFFGAFARIEMIHVRKPLRRNCDRSDRPGDRRTGRGRWLLPVLLLPLRLLHLCLLLVLPVPRPLLGLGLVGLARLPDVRTIPLRPPLRPRRRGRDPPAAV